MKPIFSLIHATRGRPQKALTAMRLWQDNATSVVPFEMDYVLGLNIEEWAEHRDIFRSAFPRSAASPFAGSAPAWNTAAMMAKGDVLIQVSDDFIPPPHWDALLYAEAAKADGKPFVIQVSDGHRKDGLLTMLICSRSYMELQGHFLLPEYQSVFSDTDATICIHKNVRAGKAVLIDARHLVFEHRHHWHDKSVPWDATYARQNSASAYANGRALFLSRHPDWKEFGVIDSI